uniref:LAGLIDADG endonuclease n=1 Tax=Juglanconis sp. TaxID=2041886 RepID=A0A291LJ91_9PEZI|nr:LAGLIDADG endonuclease [Juglanconis sp.]
MKTLTDNHHLGYTFTLFLKHLTINIIAVFVYFCSFRRSLTKKLGECFFRSSATFTFGSRLNNISSISGGKKYPKLFNIKSNRGYSTNSNSESIKLDPYFVTGLTEAEGCFSIIKNKDTRAKFGMTVMLRFKITMLVNELPLLNAVHSFFGVGYVNVDDKRGTAEYQVRDKRSLGLIKEHFLKYPLRGTKFLDFCDFLQALELMEQNLHRLENNLKLLISLSKGMNSFRKDYSKFPPIHTIKRNSAYIPLSGNYINGFIAGDGSLYLRTKSNFGSMGIQISQHVNNSNLLRELADYFNPNLKVSVHGKESIQITLGGKKLWNEVISKHFIDNPIHGSKGLRLKKLQAIAKILDSGEHLTRRGRVLVFKPEYKDRILKIWDEEYAA